MLEYILRNILQKVINMFTEWAVEPVVRLIRIEVVIPVTGMYLLLLYHLFIYLLIVIIFHRQLLLCRVCLGRSFVLLSAMKMAHAPPGHHSVAGRPSQGGLCFPEYVVYRGEQVRTFLHYYR